MREWLKVSTPTFWLRAQKHCDSKDFGYHFEIFENQNDNEDEQSFDDERDEDGNLMEVVSESDFEREMTEGDVQVVNVDDKDVD